MRSLFLSISVVLMLFCMILAPIPSFAEHLVYDVYLAGIYAGRAEQTTFRYQDMLKITATATSAKWISTIFPVSDFRETLLNLETLTPVQYSEVIHEGRNYRSKLVKFSMHHLTVTDNVAKKTDEVPLLTTTYDAISCIAFIRSKKLEIGERYSFDLYNGKTISKSYVDVLRRETLATASGNISALVVKPKIKKGELLVWLTDNDAHVPLKLASKLKLGSVAAVLASSAD